MQNQLEKATGQVLPSAKYRPTCLVIDAALRRIGKTRHGGNGFHQWIQHIFLVVVEAKKNFFRKIFFVFKIWMHFTAL